MKTKLAATFLLLAIGFLGWTSGRLYERYRSTCRVCEHERHAPHVCVKLFDYGKNGIPATVPCACTTGTPFEEVLPKVRP